MSHHFENHHPSFHVRDGLRFRRRPTGEVRIEWDDQPIYLTEHEWASVVAFLSKQGANTETFREALAFFNGETASAESEQGEEKQVEGKTVTLNRDSTLVVLPLAASDGGQPLTEILGGFRADEFTHDRESIRRSALHRFRQACVEHHGRDLLPDAEDPNPDNWYVLCIDREAAVYSLHYRRPDPAPESGSTLCLSSTPDRPPCKHDSRRLDGWLDICCLKCGADGYWRGGIEVDSTDGLLTKAHPSGKTLLREAAWATGGACP